MAIVQSDQMLAALRNTTEMQGGIVTTPLRRMIKKMPGKHIMVILCSSLVVMATELAKEVFNRCAVANDKEASKDSVGYQIAFNYEFLEDFREVDHIGRGIRRAFTRYG